MNPTRRAAFFGAHPRPFYWNPHRPVQNIERLLRRHCWRRLPLWRSLDYSANGRQSRYRQVVVEWGLAQWATLK